MHMPEMDGLEATRAIRKMEGPAAGLPIVALTAAGALSDVQTCFEAGMNYFLVKPFRMERLQSILMEMSVVRAS
jgi:CheY-like chemotaxis protein